LKKKTVRDIDVAGKKVLVRVDFNVPLDPQSGAITDDTRIRSSLPTIRYLQDNKAKVILCSHLGRPKNKEQGASLAPVAQRLSQLVGREVKMATDCIGPEVEKMVSVLNGGEILMLENLRFHPEEEKNDPAFAKALARLAEVFVNDAFGTAHRSHASTVGVTQYLPSVAGFLIEKELETMDKALNNPDRPFTALIGGAKISDKIGVLENILDKVDSLLIAGGMGSTFLKSLKYEVGQSLVEEEKIGLAQKLIDTAAEKGVHLLLPSDVVVANKFAAEAKFRTVSIKDVPQGWYVMDIGPKTIKQFAAKLRKSRTVVWNGPVGVFEFPPFRTGTQAIAEVLASMSATTIVGGGSTAEVVQEMGLVHKLTYVSTGGGASLKFLEGKPLPGVEALLDKKG
jgi:phosphoglycerate kinase